MKKESVFFLLTLALSANLSAQSGPQVLVETFHQTPTVAERWVISLLVNHPVADEVSVYPPPFAPSLSLDSISKAPRAIGSRRQTLIEYRFVPNTAETVTIEPFTVMGPSGASRTASFTVQIRGGAQEPQVFKTVWEGAPAQMAVGESAVFTLRLQTSAPPRPRLSLWQVPPPWLPPPEFFMTEVQRGVILVSLPLSIDERDGGIALRLNLIPLEGDFRLPARVLQHENYVFEIPALNVRVTGRGAIRPQAENSVGASAGAIGADSEGADNASEDEDVYADAAQFPAFDFSLLDSSFQRRSWRSQCEEICTEAKNLWVSGNYAQALAFLRLSEREHPRGALLASIRREAEESLGFFETNDESRWRVKLLLGLSFFIIFLVIVTPFVCLVLVKDSFRRRTALLCAVVFAVMASFYFYRFADTRSVFHSAGGRFAVTLETALRRTADTDGEELFRLREGRPAEILLKSESWLYLRTNDAAANTGWIPAGKAIFY